MLQKLPPESLAESNIICAYLARLSACSFLSNQCKEKTHTEATISGWPSKKNIDTAVKPYYHHRHKFFYNHDLLLKGQRIIIPTSVRREIRDLILQGDHGIEKCKHLVRQAVLWSGMN